MRVAQGRGVIQMVPKARRTNHIVLACHFPHVNGLSSHIKPMSRIFIPVFQMGKMRYREVK